MFSRRVRNKITHYRLVGECLCALLQARDSLRSLPFQDTAEALNRPLSSTRDSVDAEQIVRQVRSALRTVRKWVPWRPTCLMRAVAANRVLAKRSVPSNLVLSVTPASGSVVDAHAWLEACGLVVTGLAEKEKYVPIYTFSNAFVEGSTNVPAEGDRICSH